VPHFAPGREHAPEGQLRSGSRSYLRKSDLDKMTFTPVCCEANRGSVGTATPSDGHAPACRVSCEGAKVRD
jgi:hypothetical protein